MEDALNLRDTKIYDKITTEDGKEKRVLNKAETMVAQQKQEMIREAFKEWVFKDIDRREALCRTYNELFNSIRPREYDGSHIRFVGMNPEIIMMAHQKNAVAHILYGNNTLLAHCVGAGKTFEMVAAGMEEQAAGAFPQEPLCSAKPPDEAVGQRFPSPLSGGKYPCVNEKGL